MQTTSSPDAAREQAFSVCGLRVLQRGWLSSNNVLFTGHSAPTLIDTGYASHSAQTVALLEQLLEGRALEQIVNTHLHSDHCGGNAALQQRYPKVQTWIPAGEAASVRNWDHALLSYQATGQTCPPFRFEHVLKHGESLCLAGHPWHIHAAPGHDPHSVVLFQPEQRILISADALWENGFGVVFPELDGEDAFAAVGATLDLIEALAPLHVIPGHGAPFSDLAPALERARTRLRKFVEHPASHQRYGLKVLLKFKLLEWQQIPLTALHQWSQNTPYLHRELQRVAERGEDPLQWLHSLVNDLCRSGAARLEGDILVDQ